MTMKYSGKQEGAVLIVSLILLVVITVLGVAGINSGVMEMRMSVNEEVRTLALQTAQAAVDEVSEKTTNFVVTGLPGDVVKCSSNLSCVSTTLSLSGPASTVHDEIQVKRISPEFGNPNSTRRGGNEASLEKFQAAYFQIEAEHDSTENAGGRAKLVQGYMVLVPRVE